MKDHPELTRIDEVLVQLKQKTEEQDNQLMNPLMDPQPTTMADFFEASRGTWLNRRVVHHLDCQEDEAADSNLIIEPFDNNDPVVEKVCLISMSRSVTPLEEPGSGGKAI